MCLGLGVHLHICVHTQRGGLWVEPIEVLQIPGPNRTPTPDSEAPSPGRKPSSTHSVAVPREALHLQPHPCCDPFLSVTPATRISGHFLQYDNAFFGSCIGGHRGGSPEVPPGERHEADVAKSTVLE